MLNNGSVVVCRVFRVAVSLAGVVVVGNHATCPLPDCADLVLLVRSEIRESFEKVMKCVAVLRLGGLCLTNFFFQLSNAHLILLMAFFEAREGRVK